MRLIYFVFALMLLSSCDEGAQEETAKTQPDTAEQQKPQPSAPEQPAIEEDTIGTKTETEADWTAGIRSAEHTVSGVTILSEIRTSSKDDFDRLVFEFEGAELPSWHIEYIDKPVRQCGSGNTTDIAGDGWLEVRMEPTNAHDEEGKATIGDRERKFTYRNLKELEITCDFEAMTTIVGGVGSPNKYRVMELKNPARLVVDVRN